MTRRIRIVDCDVNDPDPDRNRYRARTLVSSLDSDLHNAISEARVRVCKPYNRDVDLTLNHALSVVADLGARINLDLDLDCALGRARILDGYLHHADDLLQGSDLVVADGLPSADKWRRFDEESDAAIRSMLGKQRVRIREIVDLLEHTADVPLTGMGKAAGEDKAPRRMAVRVLARVVRALPAGERERYRQEFLGELHALAREGASGRVQLGYALHAAVNALSLRRALRAPRPGRERVR